MKEEPKFNEGDWVFVEKSAILYSNRVGNIERVLDVDYNKNKYWVRIGYLEWEPEGHLRHATEKEILMHRLS